ncbi:MAG: hypothetical protein H6559_24925 [Lewinellaceae bacterium]|nr:hypothetical protein [Lewinellaceae bacterium]
MQKGVRFRQFCYTHALGSGFQSEKGWQAVGVSHPPYFENKLQSYYSLAFPPEHQRLKSFTIMGLQMVNGLPVLIRIVNAGLTVEGRPGNILAHFLIPFEEDVEYFYAADICRLFLASSDSENPIWLDKWENAMPRDLAKEPFLDLEGWLETGDISAALGFLRISGNTEKDVYRKLKIAAALSIRPQDTRYLLIKPPATDNPEKDGVHLVRLLWAMLSPSQRKHVSFWLGKDELKGSGSSWLMLSRDSEKQISRQMLQESVYGFDFRNGQLSPGEIFEDLAKPSSGHSFDDLHPETLKQQIVRQNEKFDKMLDHFAYEGIDPVKIDRLLQYLAGEKLQDHYYDPSRLSRIMTEKGANWTPEENLATVKSLFFISGQLILKNKNNDARNFLQKGFNLSDPKWPNPTMSALSFCLADQLQAISKAFSVEEQQHIESLLDYLKQLFESLESFEGHAFRPHQSMLSLSHIGRELYSRYCSGQNMRIGFGGFLFACIAQGTARPGQSFCEEILQESDTSISEAEGDPGAEQKWYTRLLLWLKNAGSSEESPAAAELNSLYRQTPGYFERILLLKALGQYNLVPGINSLVELYRFAADAQQEKEQEYIYKIYHNFVLHQRHAPLSTAFRESLMKDFVGKEQEEKIGEEIHIRLLEGEQRAAAQMANPAFPGFIKSDKQGTDAIRDDEQEVILYLANIFEDYYDEDSIDLTAIIRALLQKNNQLKFFWARAVIAYLNKNKDTFDLNRILSIGKACDFLFDKASLGRLAEQGDANVNEFRDVLFKKALDDIVRNIKAGADVEAPAEEEEPEEEEEAPEEEKNRPYRPIRLNIQKIRQANKQQLLENIRIFQLREYIPVYVKHRLDKSDFYFFEGDPVSLAMLCKVVSFFSVNKTRYETAGDFLKEIQEKYNRSKDFREQEKTLLGPELHLFYWYYQNLDRNEDTRKKEAPIFSADEFILECLVKLSNLQREDSLKRAWQKIESRFSLLFGPLPEFELKEKEPAPVIPLLALLLEKSKVEYRDDVFSEVLEKIFTPLKSALKENDPDVERHRAYWKYMAAVTGWVYRDFYFSKVSPVNKAKQYLPFKDSDGQALNVFLFLRELSGSIDEYENEFQIKAKGIRKQALAFLGDHHGTGLFEHENIIKEYIRYFDFQKFASSRVEKLDVLFRGREPEEISFLIDCLLAPECFQLKPFLRFLKEGIYHQDGFISKVISLEINYQKGWKNKIKKQYEASSLMLRLWEKEEFKLAPEHIFKPLEIALLGADKHYLRQFRREVLMKPRYKDKIPEFMGILYMMEEFSAKEKFNQLIKSLQKDLEDNKKKIRAELCPAFRKAFLQILNGDFDKDKRNRDILSGVSDSLGAFICLDLAFDEKRELYRHYINHHPGANPEGEIKSLLSKKTGENEKAYPKHLINSL